MKVFVHKPFHLSRDDGTSVQYAAGEQDMPEVDATHWWTAAHADVKESGKRVVKESGKKSSKENESHDSGTDAEGSGEGADKP